MQRNVHSSVIDGLVLSGLEPEFVGSRDRPRAGARALPDPGGTRGGARPRTGRRGRVRRSRPPTSARSPTSRRSPRSPTSAACRSVVRRGLGRAPALLDRLPKSALASGADVVVSSIHKIVGSLTQSAILHLGVGGRIDESLLDRAVTLTESTSPSALLGGSLDAARRHAATEGEELLGETIDVLAEARERVREIPGLDVLDERIAGARSVAGWDPLRLSIDVRGTGSSGHRIADADARARRHQPRAGVRERRRRGVRHRRAGRSGGRAAARRAPARRRGARRRAANRRTSPSPPPPPWGPLELLPRRAFLAAQETVPFEKAEGRIAAESLAAYPPGIPNVLPGELLTAETLELHPRVGRPRRQGPRGGRPQPADDPRRE